MHLCLARLCGLVRVSSTLTATIEIVSERKIKRAASKQSGDLAYCDGKALRLKQGGVFYSPSLLACVAICWPKLAVGAQSGELYLLQVEGS